MTLDEAIKHCLETAEQLEERANIPYKVEDSELQDNACRECAADHRQLAEWLTELKEAKRLLKAAVEDMNDNEICYDINACIVCTKSNCISCDTFHWRYTDEALKLIGGSKNG